MIFKIALFVIALFSMTSCKQRINSNPREISFWHFQSEPKMKSALKEIISKFELENNCKVITAVNLLNFQDEQLYSLAAGYLRRLQECP